MNLYPLLRPALFKLPPETVHQWALKAAAYLPKTPALRQNLAQQVAGLRFDNPVGLAAGFDKNAQAISGLARFGFGFVECGTVTPLAQPGNPTPRVFRLTKDNAVINRLGFNNAGLEHYYQQMQAAKPYPCIVGANIGKNKEQDDAVADYVTGIKRLGDLADYVTINISSPNTAGLRDLQQQSALDDLLGAVMEHRKTPVFLKVAPDLDAQQIENIAQNVQKHRIDALIVSNTTLARPDSLKSPHRSQQGGLSGAPLMAPSTRILAEFASILRGSIPLIGVGGIASGADAYAKIRAGASLVQLYTGLIYHGPALIPRILDELETCLQADGFSHLREAIGVDVAG